jgi:hypothetical protein
MTVDAETIGTPPPGREISGKLVVAGMILMGLTATAVMLIYWDLHTKPFRPLTEAIGRTFKYSLPKVEGGRHKKGPMTLRIAMRVPFPPEVDEQSAQDTLAVVKGLIRQHADLTGYEQVQIHFFHMVPEAAMKSRLFDLTPADILSSD